jgi:hypothetical protein
MSIPSIQTPSFVARYRDDVSDSYRLPTSLQEFGSAAVVIAGPQDNSHPGRRVDVAALPTASRNYFARSRPFYRVHGKKSAWLANILPPVRIVGWCDLQV